MKLVRFHSVFASFLIVVLAAAVAHAGAPTITFAPASRAGYDSGGGGADQVILAHLNLAVPGEIDMVVCNTNGYSVFLGNGDGTFTFNNTYPTAGTGANLCAVADVNGDGFLDILATTIYNANGTNGGVDVLLGNGDGTFNSNGPTSVNAGPTETFAIAVGDVNNDGFPDLVVTSDCQPETCLNGNVTLLLGKGDGTFQLPIIITATQGGPIALADMNHDGNLDIVFDGGVMLGDGAGDFAQVSAGGELLGGATSIAVADVNGDGIPDVVEVTDANEADVLLGNGDGTLQDPALKYKTGGFWPLSVTIADINGDGLPDLIVANECQFQQKTGQGSKGECNSIGEVSVLTSKGGVGPSFAGFNTAHTFPTGGYEASSAAVADVNADGRPDLVISNICTTPNFNTPCTSDGWVEVLLNTSSFTTTTTLVPTPNPSLVNQSVLLTATITSSGSVITNGDLVTFYDGTNVIGTGTTGPTPGVATLPWAFTSSGKHFLKAIFAGDVWNASSSGLATQVVDLYPSTTTLTSSSPNPSTHGQSVTIMATVSSAEVGGPTGTVTFKNAITNAGYGSATLSGGVATLITTRLPVGTLTIEAVYNGDSQSAKSTSTPITQVVNP